MRFSRSSLYLVYLILRSQDILEKFEFFPIKCRIQRAIETFKIKRLEEEQYGEQEHIYKLKVVLDSFRFI